MDFIYKRAGIDDIDTLVMARIDTLRAANKLDAFTDMPVVEAESRKYYMDALQNDAHIAYLIFDRDILVGTGGVSFYQVMPTYHNPTGQKAYIMNMYTLPQYRRKGIAYKTLGLLVSAAKEKGILHIALEATDLGRPLYEKYGFILANNEMLLPECM